MAGIARYGSYVPYFRVLRSEIGAGRGERAVASFDEDSVSMAVEAAREPLRESAAPEALVFATTSPPYAEKLNAATLQAALSLPETLRSLELASAPRMGLGALLLGLDLATAGQHTLVSMADVVVGGPGGVRESQGGDAAAAFITGPDDEACAVCVARASATTEVLDAWRLPEERFVNQWEERFGAEVLAPVLQNTVTRALHEAGIEPTDLTTVIVDATNARAAAGLPRALKLKPGSTALAPETASSSPRWQTAVTRPSSR
jgi:3-hydroxy-3-methylglutaryl CoA synthase